MNLKPGASKKKKNYRQPRNINNAVNLNQGTWMENEPQPRNIDNMVKLKQGTLIKL